MYFYNYNLSLSMNKLIFLILIFHDISISKCPVKSMSNDDETTATTTTFYNVFIPPEIGLEELNMELDIIKEQLALREKSTHPAAPLYFHSIGKDIKELPNCINCERIGYTYRSTGDETLTLSKLYEYCKGNPDKRVAYIHNNRLFGKVNDATIRNIVTKSVFTDECFMMKNPSRSTTNNINNKSSSCKCNVCSARFTPLPHYHTSGNMWTADCAYISNLIHPSSFIEKMDINIDTAPSNRLGNPKSIPAPWVGKGKFAHVHWVHSHPDVCPCDVYPSMYTWDQHLPRQDWAPDLAKAPRYSSILDYEKKFEKFITSDDNDRRNWVSLAGRIHEWRSLYGQIPDIKSWVWTFYDEGADYLLNFEGI